MHGNAAKIRFLREATLSTVATVATPKHHWRQPWLVFLQRRSGARRRSRKISQPQAVAPIPPEHGTASQAAAGWCKISIDVLSFRDLLLYPSIRNP
jgi:hypothetical protein